MRSKILLTTTAVAARFAAVSLASGEGVSQGTNEPHKRAQSSDSQQQRQGKGASPTGQQDKGTAQRQDKGTSGQQGAQGDQGKGASSTGQQDNSVSVGTVVPPSVRFVRLPAPIAEIYPAWRDYDYIVVGDQILIIDPVDHRIVAVLKA